MAQRLKDFRERDEMGMLMRKSGSSLIRVGTADSLPRIVDGQFVRQSTPIANHSEVPQDVRVIDTKMADYPLCDRSVMDSRVSPFQRAYRVERILEDPNNPQNEVSVWPNREQVSVHVSPNREQEPIRKKGQDYDDYMKDFNFKSSEISGHFNTTSNGRTLDRKSRGYESGSFLNLITSDSRLSSDKYTNNYRIKQMDGASSIRIEDATVIATGNSIDEPMVLESEKAAGTNTMFLEEMKMVDSENDMVFLETRDDRIYVKLPHTSTPIISSSVQHGNNTLVVALESHSFVPGMKVRMINHEIAEHKRFEHLVFNISTATENTVTCTIDNSFHLTSTSTGSIPRITIPSNFKPQRLWFEYSFDPQSVCDTINKCLKNTQYSGSIFVEVNPGGGYKIIDMRKPHSNSDTGSFRVMQSIMNRHRHRQTIRIKPYNYKEQTKANTYNNKIAEDLIFALNPITIPENTTIKCNKENVTITPGTYTCETFAQELQQSINRTMNWKNDIDKIYIHYSEATEKFSFWKLIDNFSISLGWLLGRYLGFESLTRANCSFYESDICVTFPYNTLNRYYVERLGDYLKISICDNYDTQPVDFHISGPLASFLGLYQSSKLSWRTPNIEKILNDQPDILYLHVEGVVNDVAVNDIALSGDKSIIGILERSGNTYRLTKPTGTLKIAASVGKTLRICFTTPWGTPYNTRMLKNSLSIRFNV